MVQEPKYITDCWSDILQELGKRVKLDEMQKLLVDLMPTCFNEAEGRGIWSEDRVICLQSS